MSAARFEPRGAETWRDPFPMYRALRDHEPVHYVADNGEGEDYFVLSRFDDVLAASVDARTWSSAQGLTFSYGEMGKLGLEAPIVMMDPPEHTSLRKLIIKRLTPQQILRLDPLVRDFVFERVERLREAGSGCIVEELLKPMASLVVAQALGVPHDDREVFGRWTSAIMDASAGGDVLSAGEAVGEMFAFFQDLIEKRRSEPRDDMISAMVHGRLGGKPGGEDGGEVSLAKMLGVGFTMVTGGNDTIVGMLGGALEVLTEDPEQRRLLLRDPELMKGAVEEFLRFTSPVQGLARTATRNVEIAGTRIPEGRKTLLLYASANRDEREFGESAGRCDVTRKIRRHLAFSYGPHHCIGAAAARLQARVVLEELLSRCPEFAVDVAGGRYAPGAFVRRHEHLPFEAKGGVA